MTQVERLRDRLLREGLSDDMADEFIETSTQGAWARLHDAFDPLFAPLVRFGEWQTRMISWLWDRLVNVRRGKR